MRMSSETVNVGFRVWRLSGLEVQASPSEWTEDTKQPLGFVLHFFSRCFVFLEGFTHSEHLFYFLVQQVFLHSHLLSVCVFSQVPFPGGLFASPSCSLFCICLVMNGSLSLVCFSFPRNFVALCDNLAHFQIGEKNSSRQKKKKYSVELRWQVGQNSQWCCSENPPIRITQDHAVHSVSY